MANQTNEVAQAIALLKSDPKMTRYAAAKQCGITPGALYHSKECKKLFQERSATNQGEK